MDIPFFSRECKKGSKPQKGMNKAFIARDILAKIVKTYLRKEKYRFWTIFFLFNKPFCSNELHPTRRIYIRLRVQFVRSETFFPIPFLIGNVEDWL